MREEKLSNQFPQICKQYDEYDQIRDLIKDYERNKQQLLNKLNEDINNRTLAADKVIEKLFNQAQVIKTTTELLDKAKTRYDLGNPPGKNDSYGDSLNWECLINKISESIYKDTYFIADDKDYFSALDRDKFKSFLLDEWKEKVGQDLFYYRRLSLFFKDRFPNIKLASELKKSLLINQLVESGSFTTTHSVIAQLSKYNDFSLDQIDDLIKASISNSQIYWIAEDLDIQSFFHWLVGTNRNKIDSNLVNSFYEMYTIEDPEPDYDYDF